MPDIFGGNELDRTPWPGEVGPPPQDVPPPPPEVLVRTMESDIKAMAESGGNVPDIREGVPIPKPIVIPGDTVKPDVPYSEYIWFGLGLLILGFMLAGGYYYFFHLDQNPFKEENAVRVATSTASSTKPVVLPTPDVTHASFFLSPADATIPYVHGAAASAASELQTYGQKIITTLSGSTGSFFEIIVNTSDGKYMSLNNFLSFLNAQVLDAVYLNQNFEQDYTYFIYKDTKGYWPGYILKLKSGKDARFMTEDIQKIETSRFLISLFLTPPGSPDGNFKDSLLGSEPVRELHYSSGASLFYGWFGGNQYLIISTSKEGLNYAVDRL